MKSFEEFDQLDEAAGVGRLGTAMTVLNTSYKYVFKHVGTTKSLENKMMISKLDNMKAAANIVLKEVEMHRKVAQTNLDFEDKK